MALSFTVIRVVGKDRGGPEQLLGEHRPDQQMRPGRRTKRQQQVGRAPLLVVMAVSCADQEARFTLSIIAPGFQLPRKLGRCQRLASLIEDDPDCVRRKVGYLSATLRQLSQARRPWDAFQIAVDQIGLG